MGLLNNNQELMKQCHPIFDAADDGGTTALSAHAGFLYLRRGLGALKVPISLASTPRPPPLLTTTAATTNRRRTKITMTAVTAVGLVRDYDRWQR